MVDSKYDEADIPPEPEKDMTLAQQTLAGISQGVRWFLYVVVFGWIAVPVMLGRVTGSSSVFWNALIIYAGVVAVGVYVVARWLRWRRERSN